MIDVFEVLQSQERSDESGDYRHVTIAGWESLRAKQGGRGIHRSNIAGVRSIRAQLFNDFKIRYASTGLRIITREQRGIVQGKTTTGVWLPLVDATRRTPVDWEREAFSRDLEAESVECVERYLTRIANSNDYRAKVAARPDRRGTTLNLQVASNDGDAFEGADGMGFTVNEAYITYDSSTFNANNGGHHFASVAIPAGATIDAATLDLYCSDSFADDPNVDIYLEDVDSADDFGTTADVTSRTVTTASTSWTTTGVATAWVTTPSIVSAVQEVVDRAGWATGQNMVAIIKGKTDANFNFLSTSHDSDSSLAAKLDIDYTAAGGGGGGLLASRPQTRLSQYNQQQQRANR